MQLCIIQAGQTPGRPWRAGSSNVVLQQSVRDWDQALRNWWASLKGSPKGAKVSPRRFKRRHGAQSIRLTSHVFRPGERALTLSKIGPVLIKWSRLLPSEPSGGTVIRDASGRYFVSFLVEVEPTAFAGNGQTIGTDLGLASLATPADGVKFATNVPSPCVETITAVATESEAQAEGLRPSRSSQAEGGKAAGQCWQPTP